MGRHGGGGVGCVDGVDWGNSDGLRGSGCVQMDWVGCVFNVIVV